MEEDNHMWSFIQPAFRLNQEKIEFTGFPYICILLQGRPQHHQDDFSYLHPKMERGKRAKIFAPFDALDGYGDSIDSKNILYCDKITLDEEDKAELNRRLTILHNLTFNSRMAKKNHITVRVEHYLPCTDKNNFAFGRQGQYISLSGVVWKVDMDETDTILIGQTTIHFDDILAIEAYDEKVFVEQA